ncbi:MAG: phosphoribosyl-ATP pyrophosphohydrolase [Candidatus Hodarchaeota archaeon]
MVEVYNKAIRDKIPEIIEQTGRRSILKILSNEEFIRELENKLTEEINEYLNSKSIEELTDIIEVVYRIAELRGISLEKLESLRINKKNERGGFSTNLFLIQVE